MTDDVGRSEGLSVRRRPLSTVVILIGLLAALFWPTPQTTRLAGVLRDASHVLVGALMAVVLDRWMRHRAPARPRPALPWQAFMATIVLLLVVEVVQPLVGRTASARDLGAGALGAATALLVCKAWHSRGWRRVLLMVLAGAALVGALAHPMRTWLDIRRQQKELPQLASFERGDELKRWAVRGGHMAIDRQHATDGIHSLAVTLRPGAFPSVIMVWPPHDWRAYDALALDIKLGGTQPLELLLKVEDLTRGSRAEARSLTPIRLQPGPNAVRIPVDDIAAAPVAGRLDMARIAGFALVAPRLAVERRFWVDRVRLAPGRPPQTGTDTGSESGARPNGSEEEDPE